jgi:hypothetical protein
LSIVIAPLQGPLHEGMQFGAAYHTEVAMWLVVLWAVVSSVAQFILGCLPADVFHAEVVGEMVTKFQEQAEQCLHLEDSGSRVYNLILGSADDRVCPTVDLDEVAEQLQAMQNEHQEAIIELRPCKALSPRSGT